MAKKAHGITPFTPDQISMLSGKEKLVYETVREISERNHIQTPEV